MTITYYDDVNVYFHMRSHYKHLKNVKSVVDTSIPQSLLKSPMALNNLDKRVKGATNEELRRIYTGRGNNSTNVSKKSTFFVKRHNCLAQSENTFLKMDRPNTRRNLNVTPEETLIPSRSFSSSFSKSEKMFKFRQKRRSSVASNPEINSANLQLDLSRDNGDRNEQESLPNSVSRRSEGTDSLSPGQSSRAQSIPSQCTEEHEYLMFLLRITEDIISNDFYSNTDIKRIFKTHVELNKNRLNMRKMQVHISNLCKELNIDGEEYLTENNLSEPDTTNSPWKFQTTPNQNCFVFSDAFKNCQDCSIIRTSPLYKMQQDFCIVDDNKIENIGDGRSSINPSLFKLLEKLSLGRVTECTEPTPSASTMNSPFPIATNIDKTDEFVQEKNQIDPVDFETFVKELNSTETIANEVKIQPVEIDELILPDKKLSPNSSKSLTNLEVSIINPDKPQITSKSCIEFFNNENNNNVIEKQRLEAEVSRFESENKHEEKEAQEIVEAIILATPKSGDVIISPKPSKISILVNKSDEKGFAEALKTPDLEKLPIQSPNTPNEFIESSTLNESTYNLQPTENNTPKSPLKIMLQGSPNQADYVMIKGPVYIYKPLLETDPKLIIIVETEKEQKSRRNSLDSQISHKTFTVDHNHTFDHVEQSVQYQTPEESTQNMFQSAFSQFKNMNLLNSDYDLTPEKDSCDNKYHYLMIDAKTSISGMNLTESLLLNDEYLVKNDILSKETSSAESNELDRYLKYDQKMFENHYVIHRKLVSSVSMPKLKLNGDRLLSEKHFNSERNGDMSDLRNCNSDLMTFDVPSQDSSLRSEGEAIQNYEYLKNGLQWKKY